MKLILLSILFSLAINPIFGQCFFGFEHINSFSDSAVVIKKSGFPLNTEFRFMHVMNFGADTVFTTETSHFNDTLFFGADADSIGSFWLTAMSSANDTLGFFKSASAVGYPTNLNVQSYIPPSSLMSLDGKIEFYTDTISGVQSGFSLDGNPTLTTVFDSLAAGIVRGIYQDGPFQKWNFSFIMGNPEDWVNVNLGDITCPIGVNLASEVGICDGEAYISGVQNGAAPYTYDWNNNTIFVSDTTASGLCVGNQFVVIKDHNGFMKTCAFVMGSLDNGYFPPVQLSDTTIHAYTQYCIDPSVDSIAVIGSEYIDSVSFSVLWSFYDGSILVDQLLDTVNIFNHNGMYNTVEVYLHFICINDTLKAPSSVFSTYGYLDLPFTEVGFLNMDEWNNEVKFSIYPNPFVNLLNIEINTSEVVKTIVLNELGQEVEVKIDTGNDKYFIIDFNGLSKGNYFVKMITKDKMVHVKKVIKN